MGDKLKQNAAQEAIWERDKRIKELEAELKRRTKSRDMWRSVMKDMCSGERSVIKELEAKRHDEAKSFIADQAKLRSRIVELEKELAATCELKGE